MNNTEKWKDVPNYEGLYQVSNMGNVKSLGNDKKRKEKILNNQKDSKGYLRVSLSKNGKVKPMLIHHLITIVFLGHIPDGTRRIVIDHINNIKTDNRLENLQLITNRQNTSKDKKNGYSKYTGVCWHKKANKWIASILVNKKRKHLGYFENEYDAHLAYQKALEEIKKPT